MGPWYLTLIDFRCRVSVGNLNDLHVYDIAESSWTDLSSTAFGAPPSPRNAHGFAALGGRLFVMGGSSDLDCVFQYCYGSDYLRIADLSLLLCPNKLVAVLQLLLPPAQ